MDFGLSASHLQPWGQAWPRGPKGAQLEARAQGRVLGPTGNA